jgi:hypothetical protein
LLKQNYDLATLCSLKNSSLSAQRNSALYDSTAVMVVVTFIRRRGVNISVQLSGIPECSTFLHMSVSPVKLRNFVAFVKSKQFSGFSVHRKV